MINTDVSKVAYTTVSDTSHVYPVPFKVLTNMETGLPALSVVKGGNPLVYNQGYTYTEGGVVLLNNQASGEILEISQGQPFTQNIDLKFGLIDPEQIESGFDQSVIRDQQVRDMAKAAQDTADAATTDAATALDTANTAREQATGAYELANNANLKAITATSTANAAKATADAAKTLADTADIKASKASETADMAKAQAEDASQTATEAKNSSRAAMTTAQSAETTANAALNAVADKQDIIPDLATIRAGAAKGATAVQPSDIADMETKTHAAATYQPKGDYATKTELTAGLATKADTTTTDTLRNDVDGLGDQVHEIEAKIPSDASPANQLATKGDLASIDALPAQAGNAGKFLSTDGTTASWEPAPGGGSSADNNGLEGDYCSKYGIVDETKSGLPTQGTGNQIVIPAQLVMDVPGVSGLTTNATAITHDLVSTTDCEIFLAEGTVIEATEVYWQTTEPEDGQTGYLAWWNGTEWKFKSSDTGNVWRAANAVRIAKCVFTDGNLTRLCFTGCRVLNKQEYVPISDRSMATEGSALISFERPATAKGSLMKFIHGSNTLDVGYNSAGRLNFAGAKIMRVAAAGSDGVVHSMVFYPITGTIDGVASFLTPGIHRVTIPETNGTMAVVQAQGSGETHIDGVDYIVSRAGKFANMPTTSGTLAIAEDTSTTSIYNTWSAKKLNDTIGNVETLLNKLNTGA